MTLNVKFDHLFTSHVAPFYNINDALFPLPSPFPKYQEPAMPSPPHKDYLPDVTGTENESEYAEEEDDGQGGEAEDYEDEYTEHENGNN